MIQHTSTDLVELKFTRFPVAGGPFSWTDWVPAEDVDLTTREHQILGDIVTNLGKVNPQREQQEH